MPRPSKRARWSKGIRRSTVGLAMRNKSTLTAALHGYIVLGICLGNPAIIALIVVLIRPGLFWSWLPILCLGVFNIAAVFAWLHTFRIEISDGLLIYRTLFSGRHQVILADVSRAKAVVEFNPWKDWGKPRNRLDIYVGHEEHPRMAINLKVFSRADVQFLLTQLPIEKRTRH